MNGLTLTSGVLAVLGYFVYSALAASVDEPKDGGKASVDNIDKFEHSPSMWEKNKPTPTGSNVIGPEHDITRTQWYIENKNEAARIFAGGRSRVIPQAYRDILKK